MGDLLPFHARRFSAKPKSAGSAKTLRRFNSSATTRKYRGGIEFDARQLLTDGAPTPIKEAAAIVPPSSSMISSTEQSIPPHTSQNQKMSSLLVKGIGNSKEFENHEDMESAKTIGVRLGKTRRALGLKQYEIAKIAGVEESGWSEFEKGKRRISLNPAIRLCEQTKLSLDWIYFGIIDLVPHALAVKIRDAA